MQDLNIQDEGAGQRPDVQSLQWRDGPGLGLDMQDVCVVDVGVVTGFIATRCGCGHMFI